MAECLVPRWRSTKQMPGQHQNYFQRWAPECFPSHQANESDRSAAEHAKLRSSPWLLGIYFTLLHNTMTIHTCCTGTVCYKFKFMGFRGLKEKSESQTKVSLCQRPKSSRSALRIFFGNQSWVWFRSWALLPFWGVPALTCFLFFWTLYF